MASASRSPGETCSQRILVMTAPWLKEWYPPPARPVNASRMREGKNGVVGPTGLGILSDITPVTAARLLAEFVPVPLLPRSREPRRVGLVVAHPTPLL